jgi:hypothetical protein
MLCSTIFSFDSSATVYNPSLAYRKTVSITNPVSGYQMKINISYSTGGNVSCNSHCQTDFDDIRFVAQDNVTLLDYWLERKTDSSFAWFWVETNGDSILNIYYGNTGLSSISSGTNTFYLFDDFNDGSIDANKWSTTGSPTETGGFIEVTGTNAESLYSKTSYGEGYKMHTYGEFYTPGSSGEPGIGFGNDFITTDYVMLYVYHTTSPITFYTHKNGGSIGAIDLDETKTTAYKLYDIMWSSTTFCGGQCNNGNIKSITDNTKIPTVTIPIYFRARFTVDIIKMDYVFVSKYTKTQPCWNTFTSEKTWIKPYPPLLEASYSYYQVSLSWGTGTPITGADKYVIYKSENGYLKDELLYNGTSTYYLDTDVVKETQYFYIAYSYNTSSGLSSTFGYTTGITPDYPQNFYYTDINATHSMVRYGSYNDPVEGWVDAYNFTSTGIIPPSLTIKLLKNYVNCSGTLIYNTNLTGYTVYGNATGNESSFNESSLNETDSDWLYLGAMLSIDDSQFYLLILISLWAFFIFLYEEKQKNIYALCLVFLGLPLGIIISGIAYYNSYPFGYLISFIIILISFLIPAYNQYKGKKK